MVYSGKAIYKFIMGWFGISGNLYISYIYIYMKGRFVFGLFWDPATWNLDLVTSKITYIWTINIARPSHYPQKNMVQVVKSTIHICTMGVHGTGVPLASLFKPPVLGPHRPCFVTLSSSCAVWENWHGSCPDGMASAASTAHSSSQKTQFDYIYL